MELSENDAEFVLRNILDGIKEIERLKFDTDTAEYLNTSKERINQWKHRNTIPYADAMLYAKNHKISLSWLLLRQGQKYVDNNYGVAENLPRYGDANVWDMALFNKCLSIMGEEADKRGMDLDAATLVRATSVLYHQLQGTGQEPDMKLVEGLLLAG